MAHERKLHKSISLYADAEQSEIYQSRLADKIDILRKTQSPSYRLNFYSPLEYGEMARVVIVLGALFAASF